MLETPLIGRFHGEGRRLAFAAPVPYQAFVRCTGAVGCGIFIAPFVYGIFSLPLPLYPEWWTGVGTMVMLASVAAAFSLQTIVFDLKERVYRRRQGPGLIPRFTRGRLDDLDAVVVIAQQNGASLPPSVTFHVVLHWKNAKEPIMVLQRDTRYVSGGEPLNLNAGPILQIASRYADALGVKFFDNTYFPSACPVPIWN